MVVVDVNGTFCAVDTGMFGGEVTGVSNVTLDSSSVVAVSCAVSVVPSNACVIVVDVTESVWVVDICVVCSCSVVTTAVVAVVSATIPAVVPHAPVH